MRVLGSTAAAHTAALLSCWALCASSVSRAADARPAVTGEAGSLANIIPMPNSLVAGTGACEVDSGTELRIPPHDAQAELSARFVVRLLHRFGRPELTVRAVAETRPVALAQGPARCFVIFERESGLGAEEYRLSVTARSITISATQDAGLFYGAVSLAQLLTPGAFPLRVPGLLIHDAPAYRWRGLMLDSARHFQSMGFIRELLDAMALHKLNVLHWHLTDDQGWRIEILKYPRLTSVGAWRLPATVPHQPSPAKYGGFYKQPEIREIVAYAATRHITIVPEIEMPGHAQAALAAYPALGVRDTARHATDGATLRVSPNWGVHSRLFNLQPATRRFFRDVLDEVMHLFPSPYIHVGGDEAVKDEWNASANMQEHARALGIDNSEALQVAFTQEIGRYLDAHGRRLVGWDDILSPGLPKTAVVMSWRGIAGARAAAAAGLDTVLSPTPTFYFDNRQSELATEPPGRLHVTSLRDVYDFNPEAALAADATAAKHLLGVQGNLWSEHLQTDERVSRMAWPRAAAVAELGWSAPQKRCWPDFVARLVPMFDRYSALHMPFSDSVFAVEARTVRSGDRVLVTLSKQAPIGDIRFTLDGHDPSLASPSSAELPAPWTLPLGTELRAATFVGNLRASHVELRRLDGRTLARRDTHDLELCSEGIGLLLEPAAAMTSRGAPLAVDIMDPCWIERGVALDHARTLTAAVVPLPFNYEIGAAAAAIRVGDAATSQGELEIHIDGCDSPAVAILPLKGASASAGISRLPMVVLPSRPGSHDLCLRFARPRLDPLWALDWVEIGE